PAAARRTESFVTFVTRSVMTAFLLRLTAHFDKEAGRNCQTCQFRRLGCERGFTGETTDAADRAAPSSEPHARCDHADRFPRVSSRRHDLVWRAQPHALSKRDAASARACAGADAGLAPSGAACVRRRAAHAARDRSPSLARPV